MKNKPSYGYDSISNKLIKSVSHVLVRPLTLIVNQSLHTGIYPSQLFKHGNKSKFNNYRPISLLPSLSKIFEYVMFDQLLHYFIENNLLSMEQFGFRPGHSTELAAVRLVDQLTSQMDNNLIPINIYIDLSKAFDTLNHSILLSKLKYYGVTVCTNNLLQICNVTYLEDLNLLNIVVTNQRNYLSLPGFHKDRSWDRYSFLFI